MLVSAEAGAKVQFKSILTVELDQRFLAVYRGLRF